MNFEELDALVTRLKELEDPQKEAFPSFADTDWRTLSGIVAREIESLRQQLAKQAEIEQLKDENAQLRQQVTILRKAIKLKTSGLADILREALNDTEQGNER